MKCECRARERESSGVFSFLNSNLGVEFN
jgi:hypothetical protein